MMKSRMMGVLTFKANWQDQAEGKVSVQGNSSMASNNALEMGYVDCVDSVAPGVVAMGQHNLLWLWNTEFEDHAPDV